MTPANGRDLLLADLEQFGEALSRNEEIGEKRFRFFVSLVTAVGGALGALATATGNAAVRPGERNLAGLDPLHEVAAVAVGFLLLVGILTYLRMLQRNRVTDEYKRTLTYIRRLLAVDCEGLGTYQVPLSDGARTRWRRFLTGGYAQTMAILDAVLLLALGLLLGLGLVVSLAGAVLGAVLLLAPAMARRGAGDRSQYFRASVGAVIADRTGRVLSLERIDVEDAWQFPQGGLREGEEPAAGILREVHEETGLSIEHLRILREAPELLAYELPESVRSPKTGRGQVQYWFLLGYYGPRPDVDLSDSKEFRRYRWSSFEDAVTQVVDFRQPVYERLLEIFAGQRS